MLNVAGSDQRQDDLFSTESLLAIGRSALKGLKVCSPLRTQLFSHSNVGRGKCLHATHAAPFANLGESVQGKAERV